ncbi:hypothetical protein J6590_058761, partial [Homalodisca vitripennis]
KRSSIKYPTKRIGSLTYYSNKVTAVASSTLQNVSEHQVPYKTYRKSYRPLEQSNRSSIKYPTKRIGSLTYYSNKVTAVASSTLQNHQVPYKTYRKSYRPLEQSNRSSIKHPTKRIGSLTDYSNKVTAIASSTLQNVSEVLPTTRTNLTSGKVEVSWLRSIFHRSDKFYQFAAKFAVMPLLVSIVVTNGGRPDNKPSVKQHRQTIPIADGKNDSSMRHDRVSHDTPYISATRPARRHYLGGPTHPFYWLFLKTTPLRVADDEENKCQLDTHLVKKRSRLRLSYRETERKMPTRRVRSWTKFHGNRRMIEPVLRVKPVECPPPPPSHQYTTVRRDAEMARV